MTGLRWRVDKSPVGYWRATRETPSYHFRGFVTHAEAIAYAQKRALNEAFRDHIFERLDIPIPRQEQS